MLRLQRKKILTAEIGDPEATEADADGNEIDGTETIVQLASQFAMSTGDVCKRLFGAGLCSEQLRGVTRYRTSEATAILERLQNSAARD